MTRTYLQLLKSNCQLTQFLLAGLLLAVATCSAAATPGIAAGNFHAVALKADGSVWAWGYNQNGQLGDDSQIEKASPVQIFPPGSNVIQVEAGKIYSLALKADGSVWAWGNNTWGQIGDGSKVDRLTPMQVLAAGSGAVKIVAGKDFAFALKKDGCVWGWGSSDSNQLGPNKTDNLGEPIYFIRSPIQVMEPGSGMVDLATGDRHVIALKADGSVWAWGNNERGQLGNGITGKNKWPPVRIMPPGSGTIAVAAGNRYSFAAKKDGSVWAWGNNIFGQLGNGTLDIDHPAPQRILPAGSGVIAIVAGAFHVLALKKDGSIWAWGANNAGQLGNGVAWTWDSVKLRDLEGVPKQLSPIKVLPSGSGIVALSARNSQSLALKGDGSILEWGNANPRDPWLGMSSPGKLVPTVMPGFSLLVNAK